MLMQKFLWFVFLLLPFAQANMTNTPIYPCKRSWFKYA